MSPSQCFSLSTFLTASLGDKLTLCPQSVCGNRFFCFDSPPWIMRPSPIEAVHSPAPSTSSVLHQYSPSSPVLFRNHFFSTVMCRTLPLGLELSCKSTLHPLSSLSSTHYQVTSSLSLNTRFPFFDNSFSYPSNSFTHVTPLVPVLLPYRDTQSLDPCFPSLSVSPFLLLPLLYPAKSPFAIT